MEKKGLTQTLVVLACCGSLILASCGDQSQSEQQKGSTPVPGSTPTSAPASTTTSASNPTNRLANKVAPLASTTALGQSGGAQVQLLQSGTVGPPPANPLLFAVWVFNVESEANAAKQLQELLSLVSDAKMVFSSISAVIGAVNALTTIGQFLGILAPAKDEVGDLTKATLATDANLSYQETQAAVTNSYNVQSVSGIQGAYEVGSVSPGDNNDTLTREGMNGLLDATAWTRAGIGAGNDSATDGGWMLAPISTDGYSIAPVGTYQPGGWFFPISDVMTNDMQWKPVVEGSGSFQAPNMGGSSTPGQVFDWRIAAPFALKGLANRLLVMGMIDPYFTTDGAWQFVPELRGYYTQLKAIYDQMNDGIKCGSKDYTFYHGQLSGEFVPFGQQVTGNAMACAIVCTDIYTGFSAMNAVTPTFPLQQTTNDFLNSTPMDNRAACETVNQTTAYADMVNKTAAGVRQAMPLFDIKAAIDTLYRILNPNPSADLTQLDGLIAPMAGADVCIGGVNDFGQVAPGVRLQLLQCDWNDPSQSWFYNRVTGQISNRANPTLCMELDATTAGVAATIQTCDTPHPSMNDQNGTAGNLEINNVNQKWTYNAGSMNSDLTPGDLSGNLVNGSGFSLAWKALSSNWTAVPAPTTSVVSNVFNQGSGWIVPPWDGSSAVAGKNAEWRSDSPSFTWPQDVSNASEMASAPGVAASGDYSQQLDVFWTDSSNHLRQAEYNVSGGWLIHPSTPADLGPDAAPPGNSPAATSWSPGRIDVFQDGADQGGCRLWHTWFDSGSWGWWEDMSYLGNQPAIDCSYPVAVSSWGWGRLDIFAVNAQTGGIGHVAYDYSLGGWQSWEDLGIPAVWGSSGAATSAPAAVSWGPNRIDVVVRGADWNIYHAAYQDGYWYGWENLGGATTAGAFPTITAYQPNRLDIFEVGASWNLAHLIWDNAWDPEGWSDMGIPAPGSLSAVSNSAAYMYLFSRDSNHALWQTIAE